MLDPLPQCADRPGNSTLADDVRRFLVVDWDAGLAYEVVVTPGASAHVERRRLCSGRRRRRRLVCCAAGFGRDVKPDCAGHERAGAGQPVVLCPRVQ